MARPVIERLPAKKIRPVNRSRSTISKRKPHPFYLSYLLDSQRLSVSGFFPIQRSQHPRSIRFELPAGRLPRIDSPSPLPRTVGGKSLRVYPSCSSRCYIRAGKSRVGPRAPCGIGQLCRYTAELENETEKPKERNGTEDGRRTTRRINSTDDGKHAR